MFVGCFVVFVECYLVFVVDACSGAIALTVSGGQVRSLVWICVCQCFEVSLGLTMMSLCVCEFDMLLGYELPNHATFARLKHSLSRLILLCGDFNHRRAVFVSVPFSLFVASAKRHGDSTHGQFPVPLALMRESSQSPKWHGCLGSL